MAKNEGYYSFSWISRFDSNYSSNPQQVVINTTVRRYNISSAQWEYVAVSFVNFASNGFQQRFCTTGIVFLKKGQKLRCSIENLGTVSCNSYDNELFINRID